MKRGTKPIISIKGPDGHVTVDSFAKAGNAVKEQLAANEDVGTEVHVRIDMHKVPAARR